MFVEIKLFFCLSFFLILFSFIMYVLHEEFVFKVRDIKITLRNFLFKKLMICESNWLINYFKKKYIFDQYTRIDRNL